MGTVGCLAHHVGAELPPQGYAVPLNSLRCGCTWTVGMGTLHGDPPRVSNEIRGAVLAESLSIHLTQRPSPEAAFPSPYLLPLS